MAQAIRAMITATLVGFRASKADVCERRFQLAADDYLAATINPMYLEDRLGDV